MRKHRDEYDSPLDALITLAKRLSVLPHTTDHGLQTLSLFAQLWFRLLNTKFLHAAAQRIDMHPQG